MMEMYRFAMNKPHDFLRKRRVHYAVKSRLIKEARFTLGWRALEAPAAFAMVPRVVLLVRSTCWAGCARLVLGRRMGELCTQLVVLLACNVVLIGRPWLRRLGARCRNVEFVYGFRKSLILSVKGLDAPLNILQVTHLL